MEIISLESFVSCYMPDLHRENERISHALLLILDFDYISMQSILLQLFVIHTFSKSQSPKKQQ